MSDAQTVAAAVLRRALDDACDRLDDIERKRPLRARVVEEARQFWQSDAREWRESREAWCDAAGWHPEYAQKVALRQIAAAGDAPKSDKPLSQPERIRREHAAGASVVALAKQYNVKPAEVRKFLRRKASRYA